MNNLDKYIQFLKEEDYYEAHEILEEVWFPRRFEDDDEMNLVKGFINAAVCFELHKKGRSKSSKKVWKNYLKYRPLLYKVKSEYLNDYHQIARFIEDLYRNLYSEKKL